MPCMCGDTQCPSCGPAQGYDPVGELIVDFVAHKLQQGDQLSPADDYHELAAKIVEQVHAEAPQDVVDELEQQARVWHTETKRQRYFTNYGGRGRVGEPR